MEYKVIGESFSPESLERAINNLAAEGWRVVSAFQASAGGDGDARGRSSWSAREPDDPRPCRLRCHHCSPSAIRVAVPLTCH